MGRIGCIAGYTPCESNGNRHHAGKGHKTQPQHVYSYRTSRRKRDKDFWWVIYGKLAILFNLALQARQTSNRFVVVPCFCLGVESLLCIGPICIRWKTIFLRNWIVLIGLDHMKIRGRLNSIPEKKYWFQSYKNGFANILIKKNSWLDLTNYWTCYIFSWFEHV